MPPAAPSPSASLVLLNPLSSPRNGYNFDVLMLKRHAKASAFSSMHVFPGGNLDPADASEAWDSLFPSISNDEERARRICCLRETFEESGVLLAKGLSQVLSSDERKRWRAKINKDASQFLELFRKHQAIPDIERLTLRGRWITPRHMKKRFNTSFYFTTLPQTATAPSPEEPVAIADKAETTIAEWLTPSEAIDQCIAGAVAEHDKQPETGIVMITPQVYHLGELPTSWESLVDPDSGYIRPRKVFAWEPQPGAGTVLLPGDPEYTHDAPVGFPTPASSTSKHRAFSYKARNVGAQRKALRDLGAGWEDFSCGIERIEDVRPASKL